MQTMNFRENADVLTHSGDKLGVVERLVIDIETEEVESVVVRSGFFTADRRMIPIDMVATSTFEDDLVLGVDVELENLPQFESDQYLPADRRPALVRNAPGPLPPVVSTRHPAYPAQEVGDGPLYGIDGRHRRSVRVTTRNIPAGTVAVPTGTTVVTSDGKDIGKVRAVETSESGEILSFSVDPGWFSEERTLSGALIDAIFESQLVLNVTADQATA